jgi:O-methyltransferase
MRLLKTTILKLLAVLGYEIRHLSGPATSFGNFSNLAQAYEFCINQSGQFHIQKNDGRVELLSRLTGTPPSQAYFIVQALFKCKDVRGDICEFGVAQGATSALIANEIQSSDKTLHLFDSFEGLPKPTEKDQLQDDILSLGSMSQYAGSMSYPETIVQNRLRSISFPSERCIIHKGFIDQLLHEDKYLPKEVCFAYVDFDFYEPIKATLDFLHRITSPGAIIIVDDYDFFSKGAKMAVDEFLKEKNSITMIYDHVIPNTCYGHFAVVTRIGK